MDLLVTQLLAIGTVIGNVVIIVFVLSMLFGLHKSSVFQRAVSFMRAYGLHALFFIPLLGIAGSLFYSQYLNFEPCMLCWYQRVLFYPQLIISGVALYYKKRDVIYYLIPLSIIGAIVALLHYIEQISARLAPDGSSPIFECTAGGVSCSSSYIFQFGYITIPFMTFTAFLLIIMVSLIIKKGSQSEAL